MFYFYCNRIALQWRHNGHDGVSNHQPHNCLLNSLFRRRSKKTSKRCVTGHCAGNSPVAGEFPAQRASNAGSVSIWWRHHYILYIEVLLSVSSKELSMHPCRFQCQLTACRPMSKTHWYEFSSYLATGSKGELQGSRSVWNPSWHI